MCVCVCRQTRVHILLCVIILCLYMIIYLFNLNCLQFDIYIFFFFSMLLLLLLFWRWVCVSACMIVLIVWEILYFINFKWVCVVNSDFKLQNSYIQIFIVSECLKRQHFKLFLTLIFKTTINSSIKKLWKKKQYIFFCIFIHSSRIEAQSNKMTNSMHNKEFNSLDYVSLCEW